MRLAFALIFAVIPALAQTENPSRTVVFSRDAIPMSFGGYGIYLPAITGKPYSAERVMESTRTLADGTHIVSAPRLMERVFRDAEGRTRTERPISLAPSRQPTYDVMVVEIDDPVAGFAYLLDPDGHVAHRKAIPKAALQPPRPSLAPGAAPPQFSPEPVETKEIEGLAAQVRRTNMTTPAGVQGNDRPLIRTTETWWSKELGLGLVYRSIDPIMGESVTRLTKVSREEPDANLFKIPPDYKVVDETGPFFVTYRRP